jgi:rhodanese-related sulfurtransferase
VEQLPDVPAAQWEAWVADNGASVLDVREPGEWELGTLPDAVLISQGDIVERIGELPADRPVLCVCRSGGRSGNVATFLAHNGYRVANMQGGMKALGLQD